MLPLFRRPTPAVVVVRDRLIGAAVTGLLTVIATGVVYIARTVPLKFQALEQRDAVLQQNDDQQRNTTERIINVLENNERRDDNQDTRLERLEQHK